jgi:hypothetical protein
MGAPIMTPPGLITNDAAPAPRGPLASRRGARATCTACPPARPPVTYRRAALPPTPPTRSSTPPWANCPAARPERQAPVS